MRPPAGGLLRGPKFRAYNVLRRSDQPETVAMPKRPPLFWPPTVRSKSLLNI